MPWSCQAAEGGGRRQVEVAAPRSAAPHQIQGRKRYNILRVGWTNRQNNRYEIEQYVKLILTDAYLLTLRPIFVKFLEAVLSQNMTLVADMSSCCLEWPKARELGRVGRWIPIVWWDGSKPRSGLSQNQAYMRMMGWGQVTREGGIGLFVVGRGREGGARRMRRVVPGAMAGLKGGRHRGAAEVEARALGTDG